MMDSGNIFGIFYLSVEKDHSLTTLSCYVFLSSGVRFILGQGCSRADGKGSGFLVLRVVVGDNR